MTASTNSKTIARLAIRNTLWVGIGSNLNIAVGFIANLALTRILSPEIFGYFSMANFWTGIFSIRPYSGLNYAAIQRQETDGDLLGTFFALNTIISIISLTLGAVALVVLPLFGYQHEVTLAIMILITAECIVALVSPLGMVLEKEMQLSRPTLMGLGASIVAYAVAIVLALSGAGLWSLLATVVITNIISLGGTYWIAKRRCQHVFQFRWRYNAQLAIQLLRRGIPTGLSVAAILVIVSQFDNFLVGTFVGYTTLGFYDRAFRIAHWSNLLLITTVTRIAFVTFARVQHDTVRLTHAVRLSLWLLLTLGLPITLAVFFGSSDLVNLLYGPRWTDSILFLRFLVIYALASPFVTLSIWLSTALGHSRTTVLLTASQAVTIIVVATPLTIRFGAIGTLIGVGITNIVALGLSCYYVFRQVPLGFGEVFGAPLFSAAVTALALLALSNLNGWSSLHTYVRLVIIGISGPGIFLITVFLCRPTVMIERMKYLWQTWHTR